MAVFVLPKWAKFNDLTRHLKPYQKFSARTQLFTRMSLDDSTQQEVASPAPWHVQLWLVDANCSFYDPGPTTISNEPTSVLVPSDVLEESIATLRRFSPEATVMLTDLNEARLLIRNELNVKTPNCGQLISGLVDCAATLDFVSEDFVRRFALQTRKSQTKTSVRLANGQRVTSSAICDTTFDLARHELQQMFYVLRDLRASDLVLRLA
jgi:hypothetical protein